MSLLAYQQRWHADESRFKIALKSRQIGWTLFCLTLGAVLHALKEPGSRWYYLSAGERQAKEAMEDVQTHCRALNAAFEHDPAGEDIWIDDKKFKALEIKLPGDSRIVGLPANPHTARGSRGNIILDEFAFHTDARGIWRACFPIATHGNRRLWVASTPAGQSGKFFELWNEPDSIFSKHRVDIHEAVADGLPLEIEVLRKGIGDEDDFAQEYECAFLDAAMAWIGFDLMDACTSDEATMELPEGFEPTGRCYKGIDIARSRNSTIDCIVEEIGDVLWQRQCKELWNVPFDDQEAEFNSTMAMVDRCCVDKGLMGMVIHEHLERKWGNSKIEGVQFGPAVMADIAGHLRERYEQRRIRIPYDLNLRRDLHMIKRKPQAGGGMGVSFVADDEADKKKSAGKKKSHADMFWGQGLAVRASGAAPQPIAYKTVERMRSSELVEERREGRRRTGRRRDRGTGWREEV
jgi:phage FluMu gp28-like protein